MFGTPIAVQGAGNRGLILFAAAVAELGEGQRITVAVEDGLDDGHAGDPRDVTDHLGELDVQPFEGLPHVLDVLARIRDEHLPLPQVPAQHADLVFGPEGAGEEAIGAQALEPLTVVGVTLGPARGALHLTGIDQQHLEAAALQQFEQGVQYTPVDSMATVVTPQAWSQAAMAGRSTVKAPKRRTGWAVQSEETATQCSAAPMSMPAA